MKQLETLEPVRFPRQGQLSPTYVPFGARNSPVSKRPSTRSGNRFGQLSISSFFTRHTPHPQRVRHMKGLLDVPICMVIDHVEPPSRPRTNSSRLWSGSLSSCDRFKSLRNFYQEKVLPKHGPLAQMESWRTELQNFTNQLGINLSHTVPSRRPQNCPTEERPRTGANMYSSETGRLIPPPSRAMSRHGPRLSLKERLFNQMTDHSYQTEMEHKVLSMLCQILNTDDVNAVQGWLVCAGDKERSLVSELIKAAIGSQLEENARPPEVTDQGFRQAASLPPIIETGNVESGQKENKTTTHKVDRLILDMPRPATGRPKTHEEFRRQHWKEEELAEPGPPAKFKSQDDTAMSQIKAPVMETFRRPKRVPIEKLTNPNIRTSGHKQGRSENQSSSQENQSQSRMKYSKVSHGRNMEPRTPQQTPQTDNQWKQEMSIDKHSI